MTKRGFKPKFNIIDNVASKAVQAYLEEADIGIQLVEPHNHRVNAAEQAIQTLQKPFYFGVSDLRREFPYNFVEQVSETVPR